MPDTNQEENSSLRCPPDTGAEAPAGRAQAVPTGEPPVDAVIVRLDGLDGSARGSGVGR
jgi:hypothetical protein